jgi:hypothetical protein
MKQFQMMVLIALFSVVAQANITDLLHGSRFQLRWLENFASQHQVIGREDGTEFLTALNDIEFQQRALINTASNKKDWKRVTRTSMTLLSVLKFIDELPAGELEDAPRDLSDKELENRIHAAIHSTTNALHLALFESSHRLKISIRAQVLNMAELKLLASMTRAKLRLRSSCEKILVKK